jgi:MoxR-like ATPase
MPASDLYTPPERTPREAVLAIRGEVSKVVVGQGGALSGLVAALLVRGHVLLEGVPGVAKTLLVKALAASVDLRFTRVQFTPDLMPSDVLGQTILEPGGGGFRFQPGPVFTNFLLADEINRTPPKTQAALLEAMEERQVTAGERRPLPEPFVVVATQNPVEYEGTYPLPEAQLDRFMFKLVVPYPTAEQEESVLARHDAGLDPHDVAAAGDR